MTWRALSVRPYVLLPLPANERPPNTLPTNPVPTPPPPLLGFSTTRGSPGSGFWRTNALVVAARVEIESKGLAKQSLRAVHHIQAASGETKHGQPGVNLGSTRGKPGVNMGSACTVPPRGVQNPLCHLALVSTELVHIVAAQVEFECSSLKAVHHVSP